jgi:hypothetical protein
VSTTRGTTLTTTMRMVYGVHRHTTNLGSTTEPTSSTSLTNLYIAMFFIAHLTDYYSAVEVN